MPRSLKTLQDHITKLENQHDLLTEEMAKGENSGFGSEPMTQIERFKLFNCPSLIKRGQPSCMIPPLYSRWWKSAHTKMNAATFVLETQTHERLLIPCFHPNLLQYLFHLTLWKSHDCQLFTNQTSNQVFASHPFQVNPSFSGRAEGKAHASVFHSRWIRVAFSAWAQEVEAIFWQKGWEESEAWW